MAFAHVGIFSESLLMSTSISVILPQRTTAQIGLTGRRDGDDPPVLYLLHGLSDDESIWMRRTSIERYAAEYGIAVVMPRVERSFYQDMAHGERYWTYIAEELPAICADLFRISARREDTFAAGLSMGGYGAMRLGLARPDRFAAVASLSGALDIAHPFVSESRADFYDCEHRDCATIWGLTLAYDRPCGCPRVDVSAPGGGVHQAAGRVGSDLIGA